MKDDKLSNAISIFFYCSKMVSSLKFKKKYHSNKKYLTTAVLSRNKNPGVEISNCLWSCFAMVDDVYFKEHIPHELELLVRFSLISVSLSFKISLFLKAD